jgi:hypothetical protein
MTKKPLSFEKSKLSGFREYGGSCFRSEAIQLFPDMTVRAETRSRSRGLFDYSPLTQVLHRATRTTKHLKHLE